MNLSPTLFSGSLILTYEDADESAVYQAKIIRAILHPNKLILEFSGHDPYEGSYTGTTNLNRNGISFEGRGTFVSTQGRSEAKVIAKSEQNGSGLLLSGTWLDDGDTAPYELEIDLEPTKS